MKKILVILAPCLFLAVTFVSAQCGTNILVNPGFDAPIQPNNGDNILNSFSFNGWTMTGGLGFNIVKPNGNYGPGPDYAKDSIQFAEVAYGDGTVYQDFTISGANTSIAFGGFYSARTGVLWSTSIEIYSMPGNTLVSTSNILQYSNQGQKVWLPVHGETTLNTGNYRFVANIPDHANFDAAFVYVNCSVPTAPMQKPGSGTALAFNGTSDYVDLGNAFNDQNFTVDMWLKPGATQVQWANIIDNNQILAANWLIQQYGYSYPTNQNQYYYYVSGTTSNGIFTLQPNVWQHLAFVKSATAISIYVNGIMVESTPWSGTVVYNSNRLNLGRLGAGVRYWNGSMDEVRIWNTALSQTEIRDRMCHKIISTDPLYSNLRAYYNFDEGVGFNLFDSKNSINGAVIGPTWMTSAASIGNFSANDYSGGLSAATLMHPTRGDALTATLTSGNADGIHVYNVTEAPNTSSGVTGVGNNNAYFGVYVVNGTNPTYDAVYNYANAFPGNNENDFHLFKRNDNAATNWMDCNAARDINANTLTTTGQHTEYMVGSVGNALPITGLSFNAVKENNTVKLNWHTLTEINSSRFDIERSKNGLQFESIGQMQASGNSSIRKDYSYTDTAPEKNLNYYRLKQIDIDGRFIYSPLRLVKFGDDKKFMVYPALTNGTVTISGITENVLIKLFSSGGQLVKSVSVNTAVSALDISSVAVGIYWLVIEKAGELLYSQKIIKQ
jgi:hypothetical protein